MKNYTARLERDRRKEEKKAVDMAMGKAFLLMIGIPIKILASEYWEKSAEKRIPEFAEKVMSLYKAVQRGEISYEDLVLDIERLSGMTINADWLEKK